MSKPSSWRPGAPRYTSFEWWTQEVKKRLVHPDAIYCMESNKDLRWMYDHCVSEQEMADSLNKWYGEGQLHRESGGFS